MNSLNLKFILFHIAGWFIFIIYEMSGVFYLNGSLRGLGVTLAYYLVSVGLFYSHSLLVMPFAMSRKRKSFWLLLLVAAEISCALAIKYGLDRYVVHHPVPSAPALLRAYVFLGIWRDTWFLILATVYWALRRLFGYREAAAKSEKERLNAMKEKAILEKDTAELRFEFLQQQINPHFLFNTLNFVYSSILETSPGTADALGRLSEMIRYSFQSQGPTAMAPLFDELEQLHNLAELNRLRYDRPLYLELQIAVQDETIPILPLVLLTFAENVFKHGDLTDPGAPAVIFVSVDAARMLIFETGNKKKAGAAHREGGQGIANVIRRLDHVYGTNYTIKMDNRPDEFKLKLTIAL